MVTDARPRLLVAAGVFVLVLIGAAEWHRAFGWAAIGWRLGVAVVIASAIAAAGRGRPGVWSPIVSLIALFWYLAVAATRTTVAGAIPSAATFHTVGTGLIDGWARILAIPLPDPANRSLLVLPVAVVWVATLFGIELALRTGRVLVSAVAPLTAYILSIVFGIGAPGSRLWPSGAFVLVVSMMTIATRRPARTAATELRIRRMAESFASLAAVTAIAVLIGPHLPLVSSGHPYDPRTSPQPSTNQTPVLDPLAELSSWALDPTQALFRVATPYDVSLRLAVLDQYNPSYGWTSTATYEPIAGTVPSLPHSTVPNTRVTEIIRVLGLSGVYLPAAENPVAVRGVSALADPATATLLASDGTLTGDTYTVTSAVDSISPDCTLAAAQPPPDGLLTLPSDIVNEALTFTAGATSPCARAKDIEQALRTRYKFSDRAPSGSNIEIIRNFLAGDTGTSEQFASAFALLGEAVGLPTRVVVGFHAGTQQPDGTWVVLAGDAYAWPEVDFAGLGWVAFDPTPTSADASTSTITPKAVPVTPHKSQPNPSATTVPPVEGQSPVAASRHHHASVLEPLIASLAGILLLLVAVLAAVQWGQRRRQQRRREAADDKDRVIGAWLESIDALSLAGMARDRSRTATQVSIDGGQAVPDATGDLAALSALVNRALYSAVTDPAAADRAWSHADRIREHSLKATPAKARLIQAVDLRVLAGRD